MTSLRSKSVSRRAKIALVVVIGVAIGIGVAAATSHKPNPQPVAVAPTSLPPTSTSLVATTTTQLAATSTSTSLPPVTASSSNPDSTLPGRIDDHHPDPKLTPGAIFDGVTAVQVCVAGYSSSVRSVTTATKNKVYAEYGITTHPTGAYEVDHLISLELGGSNDIRNLWPEKYTGADNAHDKDKLENSLHADVCAGRITLAQAQHAIVRWDNAARAWPDPILTP
jgi:hypothetical protein